MVEPDDSGERGAGERVVSGDWTDVRDSWVTGTPGDPALLPQPAPPSTKKSIPPPVPPPPDGAETPDAGGLMVERLAANDYAGALLVAEAIVARHGAHGDALQTAQMCRAELRKLYVARLGSLERVAEVAIAPEDFEALVLDPRAGYVLSRVDGRHTLAEIVDRSGPRQVETLRILSELYLQRVVALR